MSVRWWDCLFGHHWTKWVKSPDGITRQYRINGVQIGADVTIRGQERECERCGRRQIRALTA